MPCVIRDINNKIISVTADSGQESILFRTIKNLPFIGDAEEALRFYASTLLPSFQKQNVLLLF